LNHISRQNLELIQRSKLFSAIPLEDCARIVAVAHLQNYKSGKAIFFQGDPIRQVMLLISGSIKLSQFNAQGREVILQLVGPGEALCVECFPNYTHCSTARTVEKSSAMIWDAGQFQAVRARFPMLGRNVSCILLATLNQLEVRFREICTDTVARRLCSQLLRLVRQVGKQSNGQVEISLSQQDLAQLTGTTLFTVSRLLCRWEDQGIVEVGRKALRILDISALEKLSQIDDAA
jgi:CRP-like cAMP-binding protein